MSGLDPLSVKACSRLEEAIIGKPKELFRRFKRLGVYEWKDVSKLLRKTSRMKFSHSDLP